MTEPVSSLNKYSGTSSELEAQSIERPLSPVLDTGKTSRRILVSRRLTRERSRVQLLSNLRTYLAEPESCSANLSCSPTPSNNQQSNTIEKRLRKLKQLEEERKQCYNYMCGSLGGDQKSSAKDDKFQKSSSEATSSPWGTNSTLSRNEASGWKDGDRGESSSVFIMQSPSSDKSLNLLSIVNEQPERCDLLDSIEENLVQVKNQRLSRIPRPYKLLRKNASPRSDSVKVICDFQSASGKDIVVPKSDISTVKAIFSDENLNDVLKSLSPGERKVSVRTSSGSNLIVTESVLSEAEKVHISGSTAMNKIFSNGNFCEFSSETNSFFNDRYPAETRSFGVKSEAICDVSDSTVDSTNIKLTLDGDALQNKFFNCVSDTQMIFTVDNALSAMEFCSDDWGDSTCKIVEVDSSNEEKEANSNIHSQPQVNESEDFSLNTQETDLYFADVTLNENPVIPSDTENKKMLKNFEPDAPNNTQLIERVTSKDVVNINIPSNIVEYCPLHSKNLIELHRNKNFLGNSEESVHEVEIKCRSAKTLCRKCVSRKCEGFCKCEQQDAKKKLIRMIENIKKTEAQLNEPEKFPGSFHRKEKTGKKEVTTRHVISDVIQEEGEENVIEQEEHPNIATQEKAADKKTKRKKDKSKHHKSRDAAAVEAELHTTKRMKRDYKEASIDGNEKKSKHKQKFVEVKEGEGQENRGPSPCAQLPLKPKKCGKSHKERKISDPKNCVTDNQNVGELNPNQKKLKIEIDCTNKLRINISCNTKPQNDKQNTFLIENNEKKIEDAIKNTCDKSTSVSRNILAHTNVDVAMENKLHSGGSTKIESNAGHSKQLPLDNCPLDFNVRKEEMCKKIASRPQKIHERKTDHADYDTQKNVSEKDMNATKRCPDLSKREPSMGFMSASGKQIKISADALKRAEHRFEEGDACLKQSEKMQSHQTPKEEAVLPCGFTFASGKSIKLSEDAIKKAEKVYKEIEINTNPLKASINNEKDCSSGDYNSSEKNNIPIGFKSASGKNVLISERSLNNAQKLYENINLSMGDFEKPEQPNKEVSMGNFEEPEQANNEDFMGDFDELEQPSNEVHMSASKKTFELLEDVVLTVNNAIDRISNKNKKRLGVSRCKQIPISKDRLCQARLMFENMGRDTPNRSAHVEYSTPIKNEVLLAKTRSFPNPNLSPIARGKSNKDLSLIILHNPTEGNINKWQDELSKQIVELRRKLDILGKKKIGLEIQKDSLQFGDKEHRRQRPGVLYTRKQDPKHRLPLKNLQWDEGDCIELSETILEMTPRNAEYLHFNYARLEHKSMEATLDGAMLIPNLMNLVGLSEIEVAFKTMAGVEPRLIPPRWITNHYRLIVWKLASYERAFPCHFKGALCVENIIQQLKYRYDREIDRAQRSALRKILEKDDVPQKRMVLCISEIYRVDSNRIELQLTDGWYFVRTTIDDPLSRQVQRNKIRIGTKLMVQMAELLNCEGCHPLQVTDIVRLKIGYNCTRRAIWHAKLGYQRCPEPFTISMKMIHPNGGAIAYLKMYVARVYPLRYLEQVGDGKIWRNEKAEKKRAREFENEQLEKMEKIHYDVEKEYAKEMQLENTSENTKAMSKAELQKISCPKTLFRLMESSNDPDSLMEILSTSQRIDILDYRQNISLQRQQDISHRITQRIEKLRLTMRKVVPILKLLVLDANDKLERAYQFYIWNPTEDHLQMLKEDSVFMAYNVTPRFNGDLFSNSKTHFKLEKSISSCHSKTKRQLYPLAMIQDPYYKPYFNEFDTVGLIVQVNEAENEQEFWLGDFMGRILYVKIKDGPKLCCLLEGVTRGQIVSLSNLIYCQPQKDLAQAIANQFTVISSYPQQKFLQEGIELFKIEVPKDLTKLLKDCDKLIAKARANAYPLNQAGLTDLSVQNSSNISEVVDDSSEDNSVIPMRLTTTDIAMSLIDTQEFY